MSRKVLGIILFVTSSAFLLVALSPGYVERSQPKGIKLASFEPFSLDAQGEVDLRYPLHDLNRLKSKHAVYVCRTVSAAALGKDLIDTQALPNKWIAYLGRHGWLVIPGTQPGSPRGSAKKDVCAFLQTTPEGRFRMEIQINEEAQEETQVQYWTISSSDHTSALLQTIPRLQELRPTRLTLSWSQTGGESASLLLNRLVQTLRALQESGGTPTGVEFVPNQPDCMPKDEIGVILQEIYWSEN